MTAFWSAIANGAILSALLTIAVWIALRVTPRRTLNAATRYAIWWIVLLATLALPLSFVQWPHSTSAPVYRQAIQQTDSEPALSIAAPAVAARAALPLEIPASPWLRPILFAWIGTALLLLLRVTLSYVALYRRTARAFDAPPEVLARTRIALSEEIAIPMAVGPFRQAILIPTKLFATMTETDLDQIVLHEATHLARRDDYTLFLQRIVEAIFPLHPVVRWITRQLDLEREIACDDAVARSSDIARSYADCLTRTVALCGGVRTSLAAANVADGRSHLSRRVELLLKNGRTAQASLLKGRCALVAVALIAAASLLAKTPLLFAFSTSRAPILFAPPMLTKPAVPQILAQAGPTPPAPFVEQRNIGVQQLTERQFDEAIATFTRLIPSAPDDRIKGDLFSRLGEAYRYKGDLPAATNAMEQAAALLPDNASVFANLGLLYDAQGNLLQARRNYERAIAIDPDNPLILNNLAYKLTETGGDLDLALTYARTARQKLPQLNEVNDTIGWIYLKKGLISDAVGAFKTLTDAAPDVAEFHYHYALALSRQGDTQDAFDECRLALENHPTGDLEAKILNLTERMVRVSTDPNKAPPKPVYPPLQKMQRDRVPVLQDVDPLPPVPPGLNRLPPPK